MLNVQFRKLAAHECKHPTILSILFCIRFFVAKWRFLYPRQIGFEYLLKPLKPQQSHFRKNAVIQSIQPAQNMLRKIQDGSLPFKEIIRFSIGNDNRFQRLFGFCDRNHAIFYQKRLPISTFVRVLRKNHPIFVNFDQISAFPSQKYTRFPIKNIIFVNIFF